MLPTGAKLTEFWPRGADRTAGTFGAVWLRRGRGLIHAPAFSLSAPSDALSSPGPKTQAVSARSAPFPQHRTLTHD